MSRHCTKFFEQRISFSVQNNYPKVGTISPIIQMKKLRIRKGRDLPRVTQLSEYQKWPSGLGLHGFKHILLTMLPSTTFALARSLSSGHIAQLPAHLSFLPIYLFVYLFDEHVYTLTLCQAQGAERPTAWAQALTSQTQPSKNQ